MKKEPKKETVEVVITNCDGSTLVLIEPKGSKLAEQQNPKK